MAITGVHALIYTSEPEAVREVFRDVFGWEHVDAGDGWLIFALPPAELGRTESLSLGAQPSSPGEPEDEGFGIGVTMLLPGGTEVLLYEPRHPTAI
jgi:hypothetical protein